MLKKMGYIALLAVFATSSIFATPQTHSNLALQDNGAGTRLLHELTLLLAKHQAMIVRDKQTGKIYNTRATNFTTYFPPLNGEIKIVRNDFVLQGYADSDTKRPEYTDIRISLNPDSPEPTSAMAVQQVNLSVNDLYPLVSKFDPADSGSFNSISVGGIYDATGAYHTICFYYVKKDINRWEVQVVVDDDVIGATGVALFSWNGELLSITGIDSISLNLNGIDQKIKLSFSLTQFAKPDHPGVVLNNGHRSGDFRNYEIRDNGVIVAEYSNGITKEVSRIALVN